MLRWMLVVLNRARTEMDPLVPLCVYYVKYCVQGSDEHVFENFRGIATHWGWQNSYGQIMQEFQGEGWSEKQCMERWSQKFQAQCKEQWWAKACDSTRMLEKIGVDQKTRQMLSGVLYWWSIHLKMSRSHHWPLQSDMLRFYYWYNTPLMLPSEMWTEDTARCFKVEQAMCLFDAGSR